MSDWAGFDPLPNGSRRAPPLRVVSEWVPLQPIPEDAPPFPTEHPTFGTPSGHWEYRDAAGRLLTICCRVDIKDGENIKDGKNIDKKKKDIKDGKQYPDLVFAEHKKFGRQWRWLGLPKPRPLYGLDRLAARPAAPVVLCEGEKSADAAGVLLPGHVAITSPDGSGAAARAAWTVLAGRSVTIWPDADDAGQGYARDVARLLAQLSPAVTVVVANPPAGVAEGWDAADALAEGWTPERAQGFIAGASAPPATAGEAGAPRRRKPQRDGLLALLDEAELWHDPEGVAYATIPIKGHRENHEIAGEGFKNWLGWRSFEACGLAPGGQAIDDALRVAKAIAINLGPRHQTWRRVGERDGRYYLDLGCERWRAVEIGPDGWRVIDDVPVKFLRSNGMRALPEPEPGELIESLRGFVNVESASDFHLLVAWLIAALRPSGPFPILILVGQQGSAKSTLARVCRLLIDPNASPIRSVPRDERDLLVSAFNGWTLIYDNLSRVEPWLSDAFCRLSTGGGFSTRELHTDRGEILFSAQRPIAINGIGELAARPDLADRAISLTLPPMSDKRRQPERAFWREFEAARPGILGALLDAASAGLRNLDDVVLRDPPRMADFAQFVCAASPALGWRSEDFLSAYADNRREAREEAAAASPLVPVIEALLGRPGIAADPGIIVAGDPGLASLLGRAPAEGERAFDGTATQLLERLRGICNEAQQRQRWFPTTAAAAGAQLRRVAPLLEGRGVVVASYRATGSDRTRKTRLCCRSPDVFGALKKLFGGAPKDEERTK